MWNLEGHESVEDAAVITHLAWL